MNIRFPEAQAEALASFLQDLVRIPSLSTQEEAVAIRVAEEMRRVGFREVWTDRIGNVIGRIGAGQGPKLLLNGHMDTVGVGGLTRWPVAPYEGLIRDGILYGRGACDMKGGLAAIFSLNDSLSASVKHITLLFLWLVVHTISPCPLDIRKILL